MSDSILSILIKAQDMASGVMGRVGGAVDNLRKKSGALARDGFNKITEAGKAMTTGLMIGIPLLAGAIGGIAVKAGMAQAEVQTMGVALETAMGGNVALAQEAQKNITDFASKTPYALGEVMTAFVKLKNMGLDPSNEALTAYGDTASAMGKSLNDMIEAVADAATGEFERLKEFGIRASSEGDRVKFTFKGVTTEVGKNSAEIEKYLINLGQTNFAGGMEKQSKTLAGLFSTLSDTINLKLASAFDKLGGTAIVTRTFEGLIELIDGFDIDGFITGIEKIANKLGGLLAPMQGIVDYIDGSLAILFKGEIKEGIFGIKDIKLTYRLFELRDEVIAAVNLMRGVAGILFFGEIESGVFGIKDIALTYRLFELREQIISTFDEFTAKIDKVVAFEGIMFGLAAVVGTVVVAAFASLAVSVVAATWPFVALGLAVAALYYAWQTNMGGIQQIWEQVYNLLKPSIELLIQDFGLTVESLRMLYDYVQPYIIPTLQILAFIIGVVIVGAILMLMVNIRLMSQTIRNSIDFIMQYMAGFRQMWQGITDLVVGLVTGDWSRAFSGLKNIVMGSFNQMVAVVRGAINTLTGPMNTLIDTYNRANDSFGGADLPRIPRFAVGTQYAPGGLALVGENGPELVNLPRGSRVSTAGATADMMRESQGGQQISLTINNPILGGQKSVDEFADLLINSLRRKKAI